MLNRDNPTRPARLSRRTVPGAVLLATAAYFCASGPISPANGQIRIEVGGQGKPGAENPIKDLYQDSLPRGALARLGTLRFRCPATAVAASPDGKLLAVGADNEIRLIETVTGREVRRLSGHQARTWSPPQDKTNPLDLLVESVGSGSVTTVVFSPDGKTLASGGWDDMLRLWDVGSGKELRKVVAHQAMVARVVFSPDGKLLASRGGVDGILRLWDAGSGAELKKVEGLSKVNPWRFYREAALTFSPDSKTVVATTRKGIVFYDVTTGKETAQGPGYRDCMYVAYSPDGKLLATGGLDDAAKESYSLRLWDPATGKEVRQCDLPKTAKGGTEPPTCFAFSPAGDQLLAAIAEMDTYVFDVATGKQVHRLNHSWARRVACVPESGLLVSVGGPTVRLWDPATGKEKYLNFVGHQGSVAAVAISADGKLAASGGENVRLWDPATGKMIRALPGAAVTVAFAPDGKSLATAGGRTLRLWEVETGKEIHKIQADRLFRSVVFSPDGKILATGDEQATIRLWDPTMGKEIRQLADMQSLAESLTLTFSPDGKSLACAGAWNQFGALGLTLNLQKRVTITSKEGYLVLLWDVDSGKEVRRFAGLKDNIKAVAFSPDGKTLAASSRDGRILLWDAATGQERLHIMAHPVAVGVPGKASAFTFGAAMAPIPALAFSPDGKVLASAGADRTIRLWDTTTASQVGLLALPDGGLTGLVFSPEGKTLITAGADTTLLTWDVKAAKPAPFKLVPFNPAKPAQPK